MENPKKIGRENRKANELGFQELAAIHPLQEYIWRHPKD
jgi:citrate lyase beta subunit